MHAQCFFFFNLQYANKGINAVNMCNIPKHNKVQSFQHISRFSQLLVFCKIMLQSLPKNKNKALLMMLIYKQRSPKIIMKGSKLGPSIGVVFIYI